MARLTLMDLNTYELHYYPFIVNLDRCNENCNTLDDATAMIFDVSDKWYLPNETRDVNVNVFNAMTVINESKSLVRHISWDCKCSFMVKNVMSMQMLKTSETYVKKYVKKYVYGTLERVLVNKN